MGNSLGKVLPVSVVIPTLGGPSLVETLKHLMGFSTIPAEILVCIPARVDLDPVVSEFSNLRILYLPCHGQVQQRRVGFQEASHDFVLQLDDDVSLSGLALYDLVDELRDLGRGNAIAPALVARGGNGRAIRTFRSGTRGNFDSLVAKFFWGGSWGTSRMGTISRIGHNFGVDPSAMETDRVEVEWLPGGCILHWKESLNCEDFFPFPGKAYAEDLVHSWLLSRAGVRLWVTRKVSWEIDSPLNVESPFNFSRRIRPILFAAKLRNIGLVGRSHLALNYFLHNLVSWSFGWCRGFNSPGT